MSLLPPPRDAAIVIVGAGAAGLSAALYLKANGYTNVTVLERSGHVGGLCKSITENYLSYDIGANYVTPEYVETLRIAKTVGAELYFESPYSAVYVPPDGKSPTKFVNFLTAIRTDEATGKVTPKPKFLMLALKYLWLRIKLGPVIDPPSFARVAELAPELCIPFSEWLKRNGLEPLSRFFLVPVGIMGYGNHNQLATPYVLKYIGPKTFVPMLTFPIPILRNLLPWPKHFVKGFQRMWEAVSWDLNVRFEITIKSIKRHGCSVKITFLEPAEILSDEEQDEVEMDFDYLIMACPLSPEITEKFLEDITPEERALFGRVKTNTYTMYTATVEDLDLPTPVAVTIPLTPIGTPWGVTQQWMSKGSYVTQFYLQIPGESPTPPPRQCFRNDVRTACRKRVARMGGRIVSEHEAWQTFDAFPYFQHVTPEDFAAGWYARLDALQGANRTFWVGGPTNFELVEPIVCHSRHIVDTYFPKP